MERYQINYTCNRAILATVAQSSSDHVAIRYCISGLVDDVMFARNRPGKGDASRATNKATRQGQHRRGAESGNYDCLVLFTQTI